MPTTTGAVNSVPAAANGRPPRDVLELYASAHGYEREAEDWRAEERLARASAKEYAELAALADRAATRQWRRAARLARESSTAA
ncbi:MAG: hypothetical protein JO168_10245 [Solirubrobacterales bacterium]|nr:hypothetical protein [Solirubrobacterales bacterium]MBV9717535.1 hypothetical protein [Solirubrobacterales bacterium]